MTANRVYLDTVHYLSKYSYDALVEIAYAEFGINVVPDATKDEIVAECALIETTNFVR
jgi:hypothetical protein